MEKPVRSSFQYLSISYECSLAIGNSLNLPEMLQEVIHTVVHKTNAHRGIIWVKNGEQELQPVANAGINIEDVLAQGEIKDLRDVLNQIQKRQQFVLRYKDDKDFLQYCPVLTGKEESVLIVPVTNVAILYLVYAGREIADEPLANLLASLSKKLSIAIEACTAHENVIKEIQVREKAEKELTKKTEQLVSSQKELQGLYGESEQARKSLLSILEDVAQKEEALRNSEERLARAVEGNSIPTFIIDINHTITHWNKSCKKLTGISAAEIIGTRKAWSAFYAEERPVAADFIVDGATEEEIAGYYEGKSIKSTLIEGAYEGEDLYPDLGEKGRWLFFTAAPLIDQQGKIVGAIETFQDITERKQAEEKIKEYSENLESMVEVRTKELKRALYDTEESRDKIDGILKSISDGLIVTDTYTRIILMNRAAEDMLGVRFSEVINRTIDIAIKDETLRQRFKKSLTKREPGYQFDFELPGENSKHPRIIRARTSEIKDKAGNQTGIISIIYDVTLEREVDRMKTEFISTAAHQLRTPLTSIQGFSEILMTRDNIKEEEKKEFISYINKQSVNLAKIINDLLDISRIESGIGFTLYKVPCNINEIIKERVKYFQAFYPKRQFDIILPKEPVEVKVDKDKIGQILENILSNAVKYSPEGGRVCLTAKKIADFGLRNAEYPIAELEGHEKESALRAPQSAIEISVADHGIGMSPDQVEQIFDKFYRADASNAAIPGTGLGMSIVKNYVEAHGGKIWMESELGKGTTVKFVLKI